MKRNLISALFALVCGLSLATLAVAAEAKTDEPKPPMFTAKCKAPCGFSVKSHDKQEVVAILQEHEKAHHNGMVLSEADADSMIKTVEPKK